MDGCRGWNCPRTVGLVTQDTRKARAARLKRRVEAPLAAPGNLALTIALTIDGGFGRIWAALGSKNAQ